MTDISTRAPAPSHSHNQLVRVFAGHIGGVPANVCDARELHAYLESGDKFADWIKARIEKYDFQQDQDFALVSENSEIKTGRGGDRRSKDYHLSIDMAKELSMVENARGRQARRYFIDMERQALAAAGQQPPVPHIETLLPAEQRMLSDIAHRRAETFGHRQGKALAEMLNRLAHNFRVADYTQLPRTQLSDAILYITQLQLRTKPTAPAREPISARDMQAIKSVIWWISGVSRNDGSWTQGLWAFLRRELDTPSPQPFYVDQLPRIGQLLAEAYAHAMAAGTLMREVEDAVIRRVLRGGEPMALVMAQLRARTDAFNQKADKLLPDLPKWARRDLLKITDRTSHVHPVVGVADELA